MCGRFTLTTNDYESVARELHARLAEKDQALFRPRFNVAPTDQHWIVHREQGRRWMVPAWWGMAGSARGVDMHINARSETAATKRPFADAFMDARCCVVADGFFEWTGPKDRRRPIWFHTPNRDVLAFAGLYRDREDPGSGLVTRQFAILTTDANETVAPIHDRMPAIIDLSDLELWLGPAPEQARDAAGFKASLQALLRPADPNLLVAQPVSRRVNSPRHDDPACLDEDPEDRQTSLF